MEIRSKQRAVRVSEVVEPAIAVEKLFVYGIFLDERNRELYNMENPSYDTVKGYITVGEDIVTAVKSSQYNASLTGLLVDVPIRSFPSIDRLEAGYSRIKVITTGGFEAYMYAEPTDNGNFSTCEWRNNIYECKAEEE